MAFDFTGGAGTIKEEKKNTGFDFTGGAAAKQATPLKPKNVTPSKVPKVSAKEARMQELGRPAEPNLTNRDIFLLKQNQSPHMALTRAVLPDSWIKTDPRVEQLYQTWPQLREGEIPVRKEQMLPALASTVYNDLPTLLASYMTGGAAGVAGATAKVAPQAGTLAPKALQGLNLLQKEAVRGIGAGATYGGLTAAAEGQGPGETVKTMAANALLFGAGDPAAVKGMQLAGKYVKGLTEPLNLNNINKLDLRDPVKTFKATTPNKPRSVRSGVMMNETYIPRSTRSGGMVETIKPQPKISDVNIPEVPKKNLLPRTQAEAEVRFNNVIGGIQQSVKESMIPPIEQKRQLVNYIHEGMDGQISKNEIGKMNYQQLAEMAQDIANQRGKQNLWELAIKEADKKGIGLDELQKMASKPGYAEDAFKWSIASGHTKPGDYISDALAKMRQPGGENALMELAESFKLAGVPRPTKRQPNLIPEVPPNLTQPIAPQRTSRSGVIMSESFTPEQAQVQLTAEAKTLQTTQKVKGNAKTKTKPIDTTKAITALDNLEAAARARIASRKGRVMSGLPVDDLIDYSIIGAAKIARQGLKFADWSAEMLTEFGDDIKPYLKSIHAKSNDILKRGPDALSDTKIFKVTAKKIEQKEIGSMSENWTDKAKLKLKRETMERNFEAVMGNDAPGMIKKYLDPIHQKEADRMRWLNKEREEIAELGIKARSKESKLVQKYGEKVITLEELKRLSPKNWQKIERTENVLRQKYDRYLDNINEALSRNGYDPVPKRKDYFRHFEDAISLFEQYGIPRHKLEDLPTSINGITADFRPGKNFFANALRRKGDKTTYDAVTGIDGYIEGASRLMYHTDNIQRLRTLDKALRETAGDSNHLANFVAELTEYTNILAGKKAMMDRAAEDLLGRGIYVTLDWLRRRVGANMIGGNISSALTQYIPLTQSLATTSKPAMAKALKDTMANMVRNDGFVNKSDFLTRRWGSDPLSMTVWDNASQKASWLFRSIDRFVSELIVRGKYNEGIKKGMNPEQAMEAGDKWAMRIMADRSVGALPTLFSSRTLGLVTQFQLEVNNQISFVLKDIPASSKTKTHMAGAVGQLFLYGYLFNNAFEQLAGYRPALDPIGVAQKTYEDYTNPRVRTQKANSNLIYNVANQLPFSSTFTGGRIPIGAAIPNPIKVATGESDLKKEAAKPVTYLLPPFGGGQVKKAAQGIAAANKGGVYQGDKLKFPAEPSAKMFVFGPNSTKEARDYYRNDRRPLGTEQTEKFQKQVSMGRDSKETYNKIMLQRELEGIKDKIDKVKKDKTLTREQKIKQLTELRERYKKLMGSK